MHLYIVVNSQMYSFELIKVHFLWLIKAIFVPVLHIYTFQNKPALTEDSSSQEINWEKTIIKARVATYRMDHSASIVFRTVQVPVCLLHVIRAIWLLNDQPTLGFVKFTLCPEGCFDRRVRSWVVLLDARLVWRKGTEIKSDAVMWHCG